MRFAWPKAIWLVTLLGIGPDPGQHLKAVPELAVGAEKLHVQGGVFWAAMRSDGSIVIEPSGLTPGLMITGNGMVQRFSAANGEAIVIRGLVGDSIWGVDQSLSLATVFMPSGRTHGDRDFTPILDGTYGRPDYRAQEWGDRRAGKARRTRGWKRLVRRAVQNAGVWVSLIDGPAHLMRD